MDYETAKKSIAWAEQAKAAAPAFAAMITGGNCPMGVTAKDYDDFVAFIQEQVGEMFYQQLREARMVIEREDRRARLEQEYAERTAYAPRGLYA